MLRTHTCGELNISHLGKTVTLCGWVQKSRDLGGTTFIDVRDRYGLTQLIFNTDSDATLREKSRDLGREFVIKVTGTVIERTSKNAKLSTGEIEIEVTDIEVLNPSKIPPFMIEDETDGGEELRAKYRYLDLRRNPIRNNLMLRHKMAQEVRKYLDGLNFIEVETPVLIKSTPEGARDFVVPSRMNPGEFYALPQSPQTFKQLLMVSGFDRYFQIVKCFRDEDLRADRQPEFTQIDCELSYIEQEDILNIFEGLTRHLFKTIKGIDLHNFPRMQYADAMRLYGSDKPDIRFGMQFVELNDIVKGKGFSIFDNAELVVGINAKGCAEYTRKQIDELTEWLKRPQIGVTGMIYCRYNTDGTLKSSVDKFYNEDDLTNWAAAFEAEPGDIMFVLAGQADKVRKQLNELRLEMGTRLGLRDKNTFAPLWVLDFPLLEWDEESGRYHAMHHPFTSPKPEDIALLDTAPGEVRANAYDLVLNGSEIGGGSIRIHDRTLQALMFKHLGFSPEEAQKQFGFLMDAFEYGAPPHGGLALGFDRLCSIFAGLDSIRDVIAFPKNNSGIDVMIDTPSDLSDTQLDELKIDVDWKEAINHYKNLDNSKAIKYSLKLMNRRIKQSKVNAGIKNKFQIENSKKIALDLRILETIVIKKLLLTDVSNQLGYEYDAVDNQNKKYEIRFRRISNLSFNYSIMPYLSKVDYIIFGALNDDYSLKKVYKLTTSLISNDIAILRHFGKHLSSEEPFKIDGFEDISSKFID